MDEGNRVAPRPGRWRGRVVAAVVVLLVLGHVSNAVSLRASEYAVLRWYVRNYADGKPLRYGPGEMTPFMRVLLWTGDVEYESVSEEERKKNPFPSCDVQPATAVCPFLVSVRIDHIEGNLAGGGGRVYVLTFFGAAVVLFEVQEWVS